MTVHLPPELAVGIPAIDEYHEALYEHVNRLRSAMRVGDRAEAARTLTFLEEYATHHFAAEERHMEESGYEGLAEHRRSHREFTRELAHRKAKLGPGAPSPRLIVDLSSWLAEWLTDHIRVVDAAMARHLKERKRSV